MGVGRRANNPTLQKNKQVTETNNSQPRNDGFNGIRHLRESRNHKFRIATWNVRTMLKPGRMMEIAEEIEKCRIDIVGLQEIRWQGRGRIDKPDFTLLYSGPERRTGNFGTGFLISKKVSRSLLLFEPINERLCKIRVKGKFRNLTFITTHAPTEDKEETEKEEFYNQLEDLVINSQRYDMVIILGDFNARVGRLDGVRTGVAGKHSLHSDSNENGEMLLQFAERNNFVIKSTCFAHKRIHLGTWKVPGTAIVNQIDHVLAQRRHSSSIIDVRSCRGPNCDSDHYMVKAVVREKLLMVDRGVGVQRTNWDLAKLKDHEVVEQYQNGLNERLRDEGSVVERKWKIIEDAIKGAADEKIGKRAGERNSEWFDEECRQAIQLKNEARARTLKRNTRQNKRRYKELRRTANYICRKKKADAMKERLKEIEDLYQQPNESRKFYKAIGRIKNGYTARSGGCKDKSGRLLGDERKVLERWAEHFRELLNMEGHDETIQRNPQENEEEIREPTIEEVRKAVTNMKNYRAPGEDGVVVELIKCGGQELMSHLHGLIVEIWNQEIMPEKWKTGIIVPLFKKGDKFDCQNYRGITLLSVAYKVLSSLINSRVSEAAERIIGEYQCGFRPNRGTTDQIFVYRQIEEKFYEHDQDLYLIFIDFVKAFDSVKREVILMALEEFGMSPKLIRLVAMTMRDTRGKVKVGNRLSEEFVFGAGVKQGDGLSAVLFNLVLHYAIKKVDTGGTIFQKLCQVCAYADDIVIVSRTKGELIEMYRKIKTEVNAVGLDVNIGKTKYMRMSASEARRQLECLEIDGIEFEGVSSFKYLGALMSTDNSSAASIRERILAGNRAYYANVKMLKNRLISRNAKLKIYKTLIRPVVTYCCETWTLTEVDKRSLRVFERRILRRIFGAVREPDGTWRIRHNEEINRLIENQDIVRFVKAQRLRWLGHLERMHENRLPKKVWKGRLFRRRRRGRPRLRWMDDVVEDLRVLGVRGWRERVLNRGEWRRTVEEAKADIRL